MLKLNDIYKNDINRSIQNVIKMGDEQSSIKQELTEYVLTKELKMHFNTFFSSFNKSINTQTDEIGVWISGFYGSGKSHLLKILSYLLENKSLDDSTSAVDYFCNKINDSMLAEDIRRAGNLSSDIISFNISSVAGIDTVTQKKDQILTVFEKTFNEKIGLCNLPECAEFERYLIDQNKYEEFQNKYKELNGADWKTRRRIEFHRIDRIRKPYAEVMGMSEDDAQSSLTSIIDGYRNNISVDYFTDIVKKYIETKGNNHHVVFLIDEMGQYMEDDTSLMLNLQTVVENFGSKCKGKVWVIVTGQEAIDKYTKVKGDDFSRILARFNTRLSLTSSDMEEVIKKRLLEKKNSPEEPIFNELADLYEKNEIAIRNLIEFRGGETHRKYSSSEDFAELYPFVPYQFSVLQEVFDNIRKFGYTGKSVSRGERTLIKSTHSAAQDYKEYEIGALIPLYAFYPSIEQELDTKTVQTINKTKEKVGPNGLQEMDINVLEILFMLKNMKELPANVENITTLCITNINDNRDTIKKSLLESLRRLENETLIQKNNDEYVFLTDEEQEINKAINGYHVQQSEIREFIGDIIYNENYPNRRYQTNKQSFDVAKYLDDKNYGYTEGKLGLKIFTEDIDITTQSGFDPGFAYIKLNLSLQTYEEIKRVLRIHTYRQDKRIASASSERMTEILALKSKEETELRTRLKISIINTIKESAIYISGTEKQIKAKDFASRIDEALGYLVANVYSKFDMIKSNYSSDSIRDLWNTQSTQLSLIGQSYANQDAYAEVKGYCEMNGQSYNDLSIAELVNHFASVPYGFLEDDIKYIIALLIKNEEISLYQNNRMLDALEADTLSKILKKDSQTIIKLRKKIDKNKIECLVNLSQQTFKDIMPDDEDGIRRKFIDTLRRKKDEIQRKFDQNYNKYTSYEYPGKNILVDLIDTFNNILAINDMTDFFDKVYDESDNIKSKMTEYSRISDFFDNQKDKFDKARDIINYYNKSLTYIKMSGSNDELDKKVGRTIEILTSDVPYTDIPELKELREDINGLLIEIYEDVAAPIISEIKDAKEYMINSLNKYNFTEDDLLQSFIKDCDKEIHELEISQDLGTVYAHRSVIQSKREIFDQMLIEKIKSTNEDNVEQQIEEVKEKEVVLHPSMLTKGKEYKIKSESDIDLYLEDIKKELLSKINNGENIIIK